MGSSTKGMVVYKIYRALTKGLSPLINLHLRFRILRGLEHPTRWPERLGRPSLPRPPGPLLWFHAVSLGEGMAAIPIIKECVKRRPDVNILMTTTTLSSFEVINDQLPRGVLYQQFSPVDTPAAVDAFLGYWKPTAIVILESELWPNLVLSSSRKGSNLQGIRIQLLQASPFNINFSGDLKYVVGYDASKRIVESLEDLGVQLSHRQVWMASSIHRGEEEVVLGVHEALLQKYPDLLTIIVPRYPHHAQEIAQELLEQGRHVALRSQAQNILRGTNIFVVDTLGELSHLYSLTPIAVIGGSFFPGFAGHNISEAAAAGCAIFTGYHVGHFSHMVQQMQRVNPLSILQVSGKLELEHALVESFSDTGLLKARRMAARQAFYCLSSGIIANIWDLLHFHVFRHSFPGGG